MGRAQLPSPSARRAQRDVTTTHTTHPSAPGPSSPALALARWFEARLHDTAVAHSPLVRLYGIDLIDPAMLDRLAPDAARPHFVAEAPSVDRLRSSPAAASVHDHDAMAFVSTRWMTVDEPRAARPGEFERRRRARVVHIVLDGTVAAVARFDAADSVVVLSSAA